MDTQLNTKRILIFLAFAFGIAWAAILAFYLTGGMNNTVVRPDLALPLMNYVVILSPALASIATRLITRQGWGRLWLWPNFRRGWRFYLAVWLLPLLAMIIGCLIYYLLFPQSFDPNLTAAREMVLPFPLGGIANPWMVMLSLTLQLMIFQGLISGVFAIGEEFGWRAYLLQRLMERFSSGDNANIAAGARKAALLVGVIHGVWHWPGLFLGIGIDNTYPGAPFLFPLEYLVFTCSLSILLSWTTLRSGSVWPAAIGHTTVLGTSALAMSMLKGTPNMLLGPQPMGLIGGLGFLALALVLYFNRKAFAGEKAAGPEREQVVVGAINV